MNYLKSCRNNDVNKVAKYLKEKDFDPSHNENAAIYIAMMYKSVDVLELLLKDPRMKYDVEELEKIADGDVEVLAVLKKFKPLKKEEVCYGNDCPICLDKTDDMFVMMPCKHTIHLQCVEGMVKKECPICRENVTNWPKEVASKLDSNVSTYKEEVVREEQEQIRSMFSQHPPLHFGSDDAFARFLLSQVERMMNGELSESFDESGDDEDGGGQEWSGYNPFVIQEDRPPMIIFPPIILPMDDFERGRFDPNYMNDEELARYLLENEL